MLYSRAWGTSLSVPVSVVQLFRCPWTKVLPVCLDRTVIMPNNAPHPDEASHVLLSSQSRAGGRGR